MSRLEIEPSSSARRKTQRNGHCGKTTERGAPKDQGMEFDLCPPLLEKADLVSPSIKRHDMFYEPAVAAVQDPLKITSPHLKYSTLRLRF